MENINPDVLRDKNLVDFNRQIQELLKGKVSCFYLDKYPNLNIY